MFVQQRGVLRAAEKVSDTFVGGRYGKVVALNATGCRIVDHVSQIDRQ